MSGPPYPRYAPGTGPGQNAVGSFIIGVSPIGDIPPFDPWQTIISQHANSPTIDALITNMAQYVDPTANFDNFFDTIWDVSTAIGVGLDIWGRIVGVQRVLQLPAGGGDYLGFKEASSWQPFGQAPFYSGTPLTNNYTLTDDAFRTLIFAKALANICDGSIPAINQLLLNLFPGQGNCYCTDGLNLTMTYTFDFVLTPVQYAIVANSGVLPRTSGCSVSIVQGAP